MPEDPSKFRFTPQVTTGNIITFSTILVMVAVQWGATNIRTANAEERLNKAENRFEKIENDQHNLGKEVQSVKERVIVIDVNQQQQLKQQEEIKTILKDISTKLNK